MGLGFPCSRLLAVGCLGGGWCCECGVGWVLIMVDSVVMVGWPWRVASRSWWMVSVASASCRVWWLGWLLSMATSMFLNLGAGWGMSVFRGVGGVACSSLDGVSCFESDYLNNCLWVFSGGFVGSASAAYLEDGDFVLLPVYPVYEPVSSEAGSVCFFVCLQPPYVPVSPGDGVRLQG